MIQTSGIDKLGSLENAGIDISHATMYMPASYDLLEQVFALPEIKSCNHLLDIGSGKGRILCVGAANGFNKVTGVEFSKEFCQQAKTNLEIIKQKNPRLDFNIILDDAFHFYIPPTVDCIFFFNPFDEIIMSGVANNIEESLADFPRKLLLVYLNPLHKDYFLKKGFSEIFYTQKMKYLEAVVLMKNPGEPRS
ncbi:MAG: class I SAM-dependent methyltransferase [Ferruginibacter sp.]